MTSTERERESEGERETVRVRERDMIDGGSYPFKFFFKNIYI